MLGDLLRDRELALLLGVLALERVRDLDRLHGVRCFSFISWPCARFALSSDESRSIRSLLNCICWLSRSSSGLSSLGVGVPVPSKSSVPISSSTVIFPSPSPSNADENAFARLA